MNSTLTFSIDWLLIQYDFESLMIAYMLLEINTVVMLWQ